MSGARLLKMAVGFVLFQGAWFACVIAAARGEPALGIGAVAVAVAALIAWSERRDVDLRLVALAIVVGAVADTLLARFGVVAYASPGSLAGSAPPWILALWALFAPMLREPMRWLHGRPMLAAAFGGVGGPLSYAAAEGLGACTFPDPGLAIIVLGIGWGVILPLLLALARRLDREAAAACTTPRTFAIRA